MPFPARSLRAHIRCWSLLLLGCWGAATASAQPTAMASGTYTGTNTFQECPHFCNYAFDFDGGIGSPAAAASLSPAATWSAWSRARLTGPQSLPELKAFAQTDAAISGTALAEAYGIQVFSYQGPATTKTLNLQLTGSGGAINLDVVVFEAGSFLAALASGASPWSLGGLGELGVLTKAQTTLNSYEATGQSFVQNDVLNFQLASGDQVVLWAGLSARSSGGGIADAGNTATMAFTDASGLVPQLVATAVPEPATLWMLLPGIAVVALARRRRTAVQDTTW